jgi:hypothetical protein
VMPASTAALTSNSLGFIASLAPTTALRPQRLLPFRYPSQPRRNGSLKFRQRHS